MSQAFPLATLASLPQPVLSVYLDTNPLRHLNRNSDHGPHGWFSRSARRLLADTASSEHDALAAAIQRVEAFLGESLPAEQGIAIFAGPQAWQVLPLPNPPENELHWGKPMLWQLAAMHNRLQPWCVVTLHRAGVRLFSLQFGELTPLDILSFHIDASHWKRMQAFHTGERQSGMPHGPQRDLFERRCEANFLRFLSEAAQRVAHACEARGLQQVLLFGPSRYTRILEQALPPALRKHTIHSAHLGHTWDAPAPSAQLWQEALRHFEADGEDQHVDALLNRSRAVVTGAQQTLAMLQRGKLGRLLVAEGFNPLLGSCTTCGYVSATSAPDCPRCQGGVVNRPLHELLPELLARHLCESQFPSGEAAERLRAVGSIGGWLRQRPPTTPALGPS